MKRFWFERKTYGWGWEPATWEGRLTIALYIAVVIICAVYVSATPLTFKGLMIRVNIPIVIATLVLLYLCYTKGETPRWQWGPSLKK